MTRYIFIIDTDQYAGNFERELCAYITGQIGECEIGSEFSKIYYEEVKNGPNFDEFVEWRSDENNFQRPTKCYPTKGWLCIGDYYCQKKDWNQDKADKIWRKFQTKIYLDYLKQVERVKIGQGGWNKKNKDREIKRLKKQIDKISKEKCPKRPPYNSVAIFFSKKPTNEMIKLMKERAYKFAAAKRIHAEKENIFWQKNFQLNIIGFRLIKIKEKKKNILS